MPEGLLWLLRGRSGELKAGRLASKHFLTSGDYGRKLASQVSLPGIGTFLISKALPGISVQR